VHINYRTREHFPIVHGSDRTRTLLHTDQIGYGPDRTRSRSDTDSIGHSNDRTHIVSIGHGADCTWTRLHTDPIVHGPDCTRSDCARTQLRTDLIAHMIRLHTDPILHEEKLFYEQKCSLTKTQLRNNANLNFLVYIL
jgi:hypothetical protein